MSKFEDHLWREFVRECGTDLAQMASPSVKQSRRVGPRLVAGGVGLVGIGAVLTLVLGGTTTSPAFAVTRNHDGTVSVTIRRRAGIAGANAKLHELGIRAQVLPQVPVTCRDHLPMAGRGAPAPQGNFTNAHWTINPRKVPAGHTLALTPATSGGSQVPVPGGKSDNRTATGQTWTCPQQNLQGQGKPRPGAGPSGNYSSSGNSGNN